MRSVSELSGRLNEALAGRYRVDRTLGQGGMAHIFWARDNVRNCDVALKVLVQELALEVGAERFRQEIAIASRLNHPRILPILDAGEAGGLLYYVMPVVDGGTLRQQLEREKQLSLSDAVTIARDIAEALEYAHGQGVVHRDIKPENILLRDGHPLVADFGVAWVIRSAQDRITDSGLQLGTPAYMSPEQASGKADSRSDVYSLGCVLYEMLVGEPPFTGPSVQAILARQATEAPRSMRIVRPPISPALEAVVIRCLAKVPADRFSTAQAFAAALAAAPLEASPDELVEPANSIAVLPFDDGSAPHDLEYFCDGMTDVVIGALARVPGLMVTSRRSVLPFKGSKDSVREIGRRLRVRHVLEGTVRTAQDRLRVAVTLTDVTTGFHRWSEQYDRNMTDLFQVHDEIAKSIVEALATTLSQGRGDTIPLVRHTDNVDAYRLYLQGRHHWNRRFQGGIQKAIECFHGALERDPMFGRAYSGLADCFIALAIYEFLSPSDALPRAVAAALKALELDESIAESHASRGLTCMHHREWNEAEQSLKRCIALDPEYGTAHQYYSMWYATHGRTDLALKESIRARELDPLSPFLNAQVGWMQYFGGNYRDAVRTLLASLEVHPTFAIARGMLGQTYVELGQFDDAIRELKETALSFPPAVGSLGYAYGRAGRMDEAREAVEQLERRAQLGFVSPYAWAITYAGMGETDAAFEWLEKAVVDRSFHTILLPVNPMFARMRDDSRYERLLEQMNLR